MKVLASFAAFAVAAIFSYLSVKDDLALQYYNHSDLLQRGVICGASAVSLIYWSAFLFNPFPRKTLYHIHSGTLFTMVVQFIMCLLVSHAVCMNLTPIEAMENLALGKFCRSETMTPSTFYAIIASFSYLISLNLIYFARNEGKKETTPK